MSLNPVMERFYLSMLNYAGLQYSDKIIKPLNDKIDPIKVNGKEVTLPYLENLRNPGNTSAMHLLNENYIKPETAMFDLYKRALTLEVNLKLSSLFVSLIMVGSDPSIQAKAKSPELIELITSLGDLDPSIVEGFSNLFKASKKVNDEAFLLSFFLKKNGSIGDTPYAAIGKVNFHSYVVMNEALVDPAKDYKVFGSKLRKKDLLALTNLFTVIFPDIDTPEVYSEGTDNKIFRYLNILLKTTYLITSRINELANMLDQLKEPSLNTEEMMSDLTWSKDLPELYTMGDIIRVIPNQTDVRAEATNRLNVDESNAKQTPTVAPQFTPPPTQSPQQPAQQPAVSNEPLSPEEIIRRMTSGGQSQQQPQWQAPPQIPQPDMNLPMWAQQEMMRNGQAGQQPPPQQWGQPPMQPQQQWGQPQQQWGQPPIQPQQQWGQPQQQWGQPQQQGGLQVNPIMFNR